MMKPAVFQSKYIDELFTGLLELNLNSFEQSSMNLVLDDTRIKQLLDERNTIKKIHTILSNEAEAQNDGNQNN